MHGSGGGNAKFSVFAIGMAALAVGLMFLALQTLRGIGDFQLSHFHFNYSDEFLRRGFIGEILRLTGFPLSNKSVSLLFSLDASPIFIKLAAPDSSSPFSFGVSFHVSLTGYLKEIRLLDMFIVMEF